MTSEPTEEQLQKDAQSERECASAQEFMNRYYPELWATVRDEDITRIIDLSHYLFRLRPDMLEATLNQKSPPTQ
jgi:hypothetical protein